MTPQQFRKQSVELVRQFAPDSETPLMLQNGKPNWIEFRWQVGVQLTVSFKYRYLRAGWSTEHVFIGLHDLGEERARLITGEKDYCWWKWNIHYSGEPDDIRREVLRELERRLKLIAATAFTHLDRMALAYDGKVVEL